MTPAVGDPDHDVLVVTTPANPFLGNSTARMSDRFGGYVDSGVAAEYLI